MDEREDPKLRRSLEEALWQVEEAKKLDLSIVKAMNFINLSKEAQGFGNKRLAMGLLTKAKDQLFKELIEKIVSETKESMDVVSKMRMERKVNEARNRFSKGDLSGAYELLLKASRDDDHPKKQLEKKEEMIPERYSEALDSLQRVWLKMKQEENKGKDMSKAQELVKNAKKMLVRGDHDTVLGLCQEVMSTIQSPDDRIKEEVDDTIDEISRTLSALFPDEPRSPKERFFKKQIEDLITLARQNIGLGRSVEAVNNSRKASDILKTLEQESIKGDIPKMIIELRTSIDDLKKKEVDVSYEEYLLKQVEDTFWNGEYIKARKLANKLMSITASATVHLKINQLTSRLRMLDEQLKVRAGKEGYLEAKEYLDEAKRLMEQSAFDTADDFLEKAGEVLQA
ncbi:MAG: hypothetical protein R6V01_07290 [Thermoplasmatota archaeon]